MIMFPRGLTATKLRITVAAVASLYGMLESAGTTSHRDYAMVGWSDKSVDQLD
jgi:hypothetical protein